MHRRQRRLADRAVSSGIPARSRCRPAIAHFGPACQPDPDKLAPRTAHRKGARGEQPARRRTSRTGEHSRLPASPASPARASRAWSTTRSIPPQPGHHGCDHLPGEHGLRRPQHSTRSSTSTSPDRPHAALQSGHLHRAASRQSATLRRCAHRPARLTGPGVSPLQRQGGPLRGLPGRRRGQGGNALSAGRLRPLRRLSRQALQPRDAGGPVQGQEHRRDSGATMERAPSSAPVPAIARKLQPAGRRPVYIRLRQSRDHALRAARRSASSSPGAEQARHRQHALHPRQATTGLHFADIDLLLKVLYQLRDRRQRWS